MGRFDEAYDQGRRHWRSSLSAGANFHLGWDCFLPSYDQAIQQLSKAVNLSRR